MGKLATINAELQQAHQDRNKGNQATYLFFPVFVSFVLVLLASLSSPIIHGLSVVNVDLAVDGHVRFGTWGWCASGVPNTTDQCSINRSFSGNMQDELAQFPEPVKSLVDTQPALSTSFLTAIGVFEVISTVVCWITTSFTLASAGHWSNKKQSAWDWTTWSFAGTFWSALFCTISWGLSLGQVTRTKAHALNSDGSKPFVVPGPAIWMMLIAILINVACFVYRVKWGKFKIRPQWTLKDGGDFHQENPPPFGGTDERPPAWESLGIEKTIADEKTALDDKGLERPGFAV